MGIQESNEWRPQLPNCAGHGKKQLGFNFFMVNNFVYETDTCVIIQ